MCFSSVAQSSATLCDPMNCSTPGIPVHRQLPEFTQTRVHRVSDAIQPSHPLSSPSSPAPNPSQHQSLFQWVNSSHEVAKVLEFQLRACKKTWSKIWTTIVLLFTTVFSSVAQSCPTLCDPMNCSTPGLPVYHQLPDFTQTHVHRVSDAIQPSQPLLSPSPPAPNPSQHQSLFQWVNSSHEVVKVVEFQLWHHSFQRNPRADLP